jgi:Tfp pilus assembly protein PilF
VQNNEASASNAAIAANIKTAKELFNDGLEYMRDRDLDASENAFRAALSLDPKLKGAKIMLANALNEKKALKIFHKAEQAIVKQDWDAALNLLDDIPPDTRVANDTEQAKYKVLGNYRDFHLTKANEAMRANDYKTAQKHVDAILLVDPDNYLAQQKKKQLLQKKANIRARWRK